MTAHVDYVPGQTPTYVIRCEEHGDQTASTQWGIGRMTIFQGFSERTRAHRFAADHNAIQHPAH